MLSSPASTSQTGIVTVNRPLDRERIPEYKLTISVKDNPENPRIARRVRLGGIVGSRAGAGCTRAAWPGGQMHRFWSKQVLGSNPTSVCQWVCGSGKSLSLSLHFLFCQMETHLPQNRGEDLKEPISVKSSAQCLAYGKHSVNTSYHLFSPNH